MIHIGFDAKRLFNNFTGLGNYSRTLVRDLGNYFPENAYFLYTPKLRQNEETHFFQNSPMYQVTLPPRFTLKAYWRSKGVIPQLQKHQLTIYHGLSHEIPFGIQKTGIKTVVTIHDLIFKYYPKQYGWIDRKIYDYKFRYACEQADRIVAISESTKKDIVKLYDIDKSKIDVVYQSCHERFRQEKSRKTIEEVLRKYNLPSEYLFYVGSIVERKNLLTIIEAMEKLPKNFDIPLVVVGNGGAYKRKVQEYISQKGMEARVYFIQPSFDDLPALYQNAALFLYPSKYEGFGIPIIEALFSKTPVITSNTSSLPEAAGKDAYLIQPDQAVQIAIGIEHILTDSAFRQKMVERGYQYAQQFKGEVVTRNIMEVYRSLL
ncbi:MAG: glycosyltransferase family 1 protein [Bacteroidota bacterium]